MQISDVRIRLISGLGRVKAAASITIDNVFVVHDIKVIESNNGLYISMPSRRTAEGEFKDVAHPITKEARVDIQMNILKAYEIKVQELANANE